MGACCLQNCNRSPFASAPKHCQVHPAPSDCAVGPLSPQPFCPRPRTLTIRCHDAAHAARSPATARARADARATLPLMPNPAPLAERAGNASFQRYTGRQQKGKAVVSEAPASSGPTSSRSRCPAPGPPAPAAHAAPFKVVFSGLSGRRQKKRGGKRSRLAPLDKVYVRG